ncbi:hypothetical protein GCM10007147_03870 [Nocardiopsis kunsanensis]|uniref:Catalytic LigB subunit of aromatic ring-opening dioxygenase n=1 Tax=Nocardiopsis kunsanensis TaxID=141693 RepID=A0A918X7D7_9ACTN|nr:hypothetical protein [Nocardiopsis kunsanensis]GHD15932.1 hypothetical protein GCM10007147_03870 [Nocardiopsis kunsanensis]
MIVAAAVCPHPPLLLRELTGAQDVAAPLREACHGALAELTGAAPDRVVVVGGAGATAEHTDAPVPVHAHGGHGDRTAPQEALPLSLGVARRLLDESGCTLPVELRSVAHDAREAEIAALAGGIAGRRERVGLLVMGDGSARRSAKAPGHLDERAFAFDDTVHRALSEGDTGALAGLDPDLATELMVAGRAAWQVMAAAVDLEGVAVRAGVRYSDDPFGVQYLVGVWTCGS